jgi:type IV secretory pathway TrbF-like protein
LQRNSSAQREVEIVNCPWSAATWNADHGRHCQDVSVGHFMFVCGGCGARFGCLMMMSVKSKVVPVYFATKEYGGVQV